MKDNLSFPLTYGINKTGLPLIPIEINQQNLCLLLDTGSNKNLIDQRVYEYFKEYVEHIGSNNTIGLDGLKHETATIKINFTFEGNNYVAKFNVFDSSQAFDSIQKESDIQIHGILGNEFFIENGWILDFEKLTVNSNKL